MTTITPQGARHRAARRPSTPLTVALSGQGARRGIAAFASSGLLLTMAATSAAAAPESSALPNVDISAATSEALTAMVTRRRAGHRGRLPDRRAHRDRRARRGRRRRGRPGARAGSGPRRRHLRHRPADRQHRPPVHRHPVRLRRRHPGRLRLLRLHPVRLRAGRHLAAPLVLRPGQRRLPGLRRGGPPRRPRLGPRSRRHLHRQRPAHRRPQPGHRAVREPDLHLEPRLHPGSLSEPLQLHPTARPSS